MLISLIIEIVAMIAIIILAAYRSRKLHKPICLSTLKGFMKFDIFIIVCEFIVFAFKCALGKNLVFNAIVILLYVVMWYFDHTFYQETRHAIYNNKDSFSKKNGGNKI